MCVVAQEFGGNAELFGAGEGMEEHGTESGINNDHIAIPLILSTRRYVIRGSQCAVQR